MQMKFRSPTYGLCEDLDEVMDVVIKRINEKPLNEWIIAIGTDSQNKGNKTNICSAILVLEKGKGGIYFYSKSLVPRIRVIQQRMLREAEISINIGHEIIKIIEDRFLQGKPSILDYNVEIEIHCDLGHNGKSRDSISAAIGWITAEFDGQVCAKIKPDSLAASCVADKYTK